MGSATNQNPFHSEPESTPTQEPALTQPHFPKVFGPNGTSANIQKQSVSKNQIQSAPVTPGQSPQSDQKTIAVHRRRTMIANGYHSATETENNLNLEVANANTAKSATPKLVSDSLLDQIMALPRQTIKARIVQFGGQCQDDDATGILVTKLFQLLSTQNHNQQQNESKESTPCLVIKQQQQVSTPPNDLLHKQLKSSLPSSPKQQTTPRSAAKRQLQQKNSIADELPKLRIRQKELMKDKIRIEVERLKQRTDNRLGRDMTVDTIASELAQVEKQIKVLTDASKSSSNTCKKIKLQKNNCMNKEDENAASEIVLNGPLHSRNNSNDSLATAASSINAQNELSINHNVICMLPMNATHSASGSLTAEEEMNCSLTTNEFESYTQCLPKKLDLTNIAGIDLLNNSLLKNVSDNVLCNAKERIKREKRQLDEEYGQYLADQSEMLLLKLSKHRMDEKQCASETQMTKQKLMQKLDKLRNKFECILNDQLQILHLTQELNDDPIVVTEQSNDEPIYLYKEQINQKYLQRIQEFEAKQKKELHAFRADLETLNHLKMEVRKRNYYKSSRSNTSSPNRSPCRSPKNMKLKNQIGAFTLAAPPQPSRKKPSKHFHSHSLTEHALSSPIPPIVDMLTGGDEQPIVVGHAYSSSMPVLSNQDVDKLTNQINTSLNDLNNQIK